MYIKSRVKTYKNGKIKWFILIIINLILIFYGINYIDRIIKPNIDSIAEVQMKSIITQIVNESIQEEFISEFDFTNLININKDNDGNVVLVEANAIAMNRLASELVNSTQIKFQEMKPIKMNVSMGTMIGSTVLSQLGPNLTFKIKPIGMSKVSFKTIFESGGINQTKYKVFLEFDSQAKVLVPFTLNIVEVSNTILIAEAIIVGRVPQSYVNVPENKVTDLLNFPIGE